MSTTPRSVREAATGAALSPAVERLRARARSQAVALPQVYGRFADALNASAILPERLALDLAVPSELDRVERKRPHPVVNRADLLADHETVQRLTAATFLGDVPADAYAALAPVHGMRPLVGWLRTACRDGLDAVPQAPAELRAFVGSMEATPDWIDMDLVREGARVDRVSVAWIQPWVIRGAFIATFLNHHAALPMALTGALTDNRSTRRVNETSAFFTATALPGGLDRHGPGFEAAAMVRLMHSHVRINALEHDWDIAVDGLPIPQVDQMPAGLIGPFLAAARAIRAGRTFTTDERAVVEMARYRCFLLGLPEELLPTDVEGVVTVFLGRAATLHAKFTDDICGELIRTTLAASLVKDPTVLDRITEPFERSFSTMFFINAFLLGERDLADRMGIRLTLADRARVGLLTPWLIGRLVVLKAASRLPLARTLVDRRAVATMHRLLRRYGHAEYASDTSHWGTRRRPATARDPADQQ